MHIRFRPLIFIIALHAFCSPASAGVMVFTDVVDFNTPRPIFNFTEYLVGTITSNPGETISITKLGIGGDADSTSGDAMFRLVGGGLDFTWVAGQFSTPADFRLAPTTITAGPTISARSISYADVSLSATAGSTLSV